MDLLALLHWLRRTGTWPVSAATGMIQFGWEICSTGRVSKTFTVSSYDGRTLYDQRLHRLVRRQVA